MTRKRIAISERDVVPVQLDTQLAPKNVVKYENYLLSHLVLNGATRSQMADALDVTIYTLSGLLAKFNRFYTRYIFRFESRGGEVITAKTAKDLAHKMQLKNYYVTARIILQTVCEKNGVYSYRGTYIGQFNKIKLVRQLRMKDKEMA